MTYSYLASPYSDPDPAVVEFRYIEVLKALDRLCRPRASRTGLVRTVAYSPIAHFHSVAKMYDLKGAASNWDWHNKPMLESSADLVILLLPGWNLSAGILKERTWAKEFNLSVKTMDPSTGEFRLL